MSNSKITIDQKKYVSCGRCTEICPDVFQMDVKGKIKVIGENMDCAQTASDQCITHAIKIAE